MAITYNPYNWEIRPRDSTQNGFKQKIKDLESQRKKIVDLIHFYTSTDQDNLIIGRYIATLNNIQEEIDVMRIKCHMEDEVYLY